MIITTHHVRPSQFITTYGVGAILETMEGPQLIPSFRKSGLFIDNNIGGQIRLSDVEIYEPRLSSSLIATMMGSTVGPQGIMLFSLPTNAFLDRPDEVVSYHTVPFPRWSQCAMHQIVYHPSSGQNPGCPNCREIRGSALESKAKKEAVRFVLACKQGHLDEVPWNQLVSHRNHNCGGGHYYLRGAGGGLRNMVLECLSCGGEGNFGQAYGAVWPCPGRFAEELTSRRSPCKEGALITQRLATNLRIADTISILTIPPTDSPLHRMLMTSQLYLHTIGNPVSSKNELMDIARRLANRHRLDPIVLLDLESRSEGDIMQALLDIETVQRTNENITEEELKYQELRELQNAATYGHLGTGNEAAYFEVDRTNVQVIPSSHGISFRVTPVRRLRVVMVQTGYRRLSTDTEDSESVDISIPNEDGRLAFPGIEVFGEGLFIDILDLEGPFPRLGPVQSAWQSDPNRKKNVNWPEFVWWHTLSHRLINALSVDSGYSAASLRERIYPRLASDTTVHSGGVLIYTSQPGSDGTLGGLVAQTYRFRQILDSALYSLDECSNDPLCIESRFVPGQANGAACYACQLVSETACEAKNRGLDRNLLLESPP